MLKGPGAKLLAAGIPLGVPCKNGRRRHNTRHRWFRFSRDWNRWRAWQLRPAQLLREPEPISPWKLRVGWNEGLFQHAVGANHVPLAHPADQMHPPAKSPEYGTEWSFLQIY
jgi:hypothetical protein